MERRFAAVLFAEVVGYSRHTSATKKAHAPLAQLDVRL
jgi:hypothetical protein